MNLNDISDYIIACEYRKVSPFEIFNYMTSEEIIINKLNTRSDIIAKGKKVKNINEIKTKKSKLFDKTPLSL
jgi:hypothetical protein